MSGVIKSVCDESHKEQISTLYGKFVDSGVASDSA
jgi:hypothetical protein